MSTVARRASYDAPASDVRSVRFLPPALAWMVVGSVVLTVLALTPTNHFSLVLGNCAILAALLGSVVACVYAALRRTASSRAWAWMAVAMVMGAFGQVLFTYGAIQRAAPRPSPLSDALGYLGYSVPAVVALFLFPKPPERLISRSRSVLDALVITLGLVMVSEATVLHRVREALDLSTLAGLSGLAFPVVDLAICAVVLTLGMRQPQGNRMVWLCLGCGLVSLAVTDSAYVRLLAEGHRDLTGTTMVAGWMAAPVLIGLATLVRRSKVEHGWNLAVAVRLLPYVPVLGAAVVIGSRSVRHDVFLLVCGILLLVAVAVRQVMMVYENLGLTRDLEAKVVARTAELATLGSIVTSSSDAIVGISMANVITAWNPAAEQLYGMRSVEMVGRSPSSFLPPPATTAVEELLGSAARGDKLDTYELEWVRPDGSSVPVAMTVSRVQDGDVVQGISIFGQDITERARAAAALEQAREEALESSRLKSEFLATMSHEIRTPMNGVIGLTSLLIETDLDVTQRKYAEGVQSAGQSLLDVINDILDFSKLEAGKVVIEVADFDLRRLIEDVGNLLAPAAFAKGLELLVSCPPDAPATVRGDNVRIRQILLNLASNAVKFTERGEVAVSVLPRLLDDGRVLVRFEITDTGIGIAETDQLRLFESFSQADASTTRRFGGTGLGLAISRQLVEVMDGTIGLNSDLGVGSTFWFEITLPSGTALADPPFPPHPGLLIDLRVIVVDDNATNRTILDAQLSSWQMHVDLVDNATAGLARLRSAAAAGRPYDLAVLDMMMPDVDGLQLARSITGDPALTGTPMIMLTSAQRLPGATLREAGIGQWLTKPVSSSELYDRLMRLMAPKELPAEPAPQAPPRLRAEPTARGLILVVEDNVLNQLVAAGLVSRLGYTVDTVANGVEALAALAATPYAAVLMDCHMPVMDGFAATRELRRREGSGPRTPVIALTAGALVSDRERCLAAGMDDYISKPIHDETLEVALSRWVRETVRPVEPAPARPTTETAATEAAATEAIPIGAASIHATPIDEARLAVLRTFQAPDGSSLLNTFITTFLTRSSNRLAALREAERTSHFVEVRTAAHELRGSAATIGATRVAALSAELERSGRDGQPARPDLLDELDAELDRAALALADIAETLS